MDTKNIPLILILIQTQRCFTIATDVPAFPLPERFNTGTSVLSTMNTLIEQHDPINLGIGYPDYPPPHQVQLVVANATTSKDFSISQYSFGFGHLRLLKAISNFHVASLNRTLDPYNNILVTAGATEALYLAFLTHTFPGDEWILFEPFYEFYQSMIIGSNGVVRPIKLKPKIYETDNLTSSNWSFDKKELSRLFNEKTKGIVVNNPLNPLGKVFTLDELTFIADLTKKWNTLVVFDESHQFSYFDNNKHIRIATLPGMFERTITIASAGKLFGATGYRIGWAYGGARIIDNLKKVHILTVLCAPTPMQEATAVILEEETRNFGKPNSIAERLKKYTQKNRDYLYQMLKRAGMSPILPEGSFFIMANWTTMGNRVVLDDKRNICEDYKFFEWLVKKVQILALPMSTFYYNKSECHGKDYLRFNLLKRHETYVEANKRMSPLYNGKF